MERSMLSRRLFFSLPAGLVALAGGAITAATPAMSRDDAYKFIKARVDEALAPYTSSHPDVPDVVSRWRFFYRDDGDKPFGSKDAYLRHSIQGFYFNPWIGRLIDQNELVGASGRLNHYAQLKLPNIFPLELHQFDQEFTAALVALCPKDKSSLPRFV